MSNVVNFQPKLFDVMLSFFEEEEFSPQRVEDESILVMAVKGENAQWHCYAEAHEDFDRFRFFSILEAHAPPEKRPALAEFLTRANYDLPIGAFEMDFDEGQIRFRTSIDLTDVRLSHQILRNVVYPNLLLVDLYYKGIMSVLFSDSAPADAIAAIEGSAATHTH